MPEVECAAHGFLVVLLPGPISLKLPLVEKPEPEESRQYPGCGAEEGVEQEKPKVTLSHCSYSHAEPVPARGAPFRKCHSQKQDFLPSEWAHVAVPKAGCACPGLLSAWPPGLHGVHLTRAPQLTG